MRDTSDRNNWTYVERMATLLDQGANRLDAAFHDHPHVQLFLLEMNRTCRNAGHFRSEQLDVRRAYGDAARSRGEPSRRRIPRSPACPVVSAGDESYLSQCGTLPIGTTGRTSSVWRRCSIKGRTVSTPHSTITRMSSCFCWR